MIVFDEIKDLFFGNERGAAMQQVAKTHGWSYTRRIRFDHLEYQVSDFQLFHGKQFKRIENIIVWQPPESVFSIRIFDYIYRKKTTSVIQVYHPEFDLPRFSIHPKKMLSKVKGLFIETTDKFPLLPEFDKQYKIEGTYSEKLLRYLPPGLQQLFAEENNLHFEGERKYFIVYKRLVTFKPKEIPLYFEFGEDLVRLVSSENEGQNLV